MDIVAQEPLKSRRKKNSRQRFFPEQAISNGVTEKRRSKVPALSHKRPGIDTASKPYRRATRLAISGSVGDGLNART